MSQFQVLVQPSGREFSVAEGQSILAAALDAGLPLPHACKSGVCGSCRCKVISGSLTHEAHAEGALSAADEASGHALLCVARAGSNLVLEARLPEVGGPVARKMPARVEHIERVSSDVAIVTLRLPASETFEFRPGQYVDFILPGGLRRSYSIAALAGEGGSLQFHIRHMPGGVFTDALFGLAQSPSVKEKGILRIEGPLGGFWLREDSDAPIVLLASGTGFAPIKAIVERMLEAGLIQGDAARGRAPRAVSLYWGARTRADLYLDALPRRWEAEHAGFRYVPVLSEATAADAWEGRTGFVHQAVMQDLPDLSRHEVYACGVPVMVQSAQHDFTTRCALPEQNFFSDAFVSAADLARAKAAGQAPAAS